MQIIVYEAVGEAPLALKCCARFFLGAKEGMHPVVIHASTPENAEKAAREWWAAEVKKEQDKAAAAESRAEARRQRKAGVPVNEPKPDPVEEWDEEEAI